ncbi:hypothetical protein GX563_04550 [Candidatus Bathyarchaeota archaeon]|nr:hypothetical protein [Candidatus Bathyarchaeota archaeon]
MNARYVPKPYDLESFDVAFSRAKAALRSEGLLERQNLGHQSVFYLIPETIRAELKAELQKIKNVELFTKLDVDKQQWLLNEVEFYKKKEKIDELKYYKLPGQLVITKTRELKINYTEFDPEYWRCVDFTSPTAYERLGNIELKLVSDTALSQPEKHEQHMILLMFGWKLLGASNVNGSSLYGRYKRLGKALEDLFELGLLRWRDQSHISDEEWARMAPKLRREPPLAVFKGLVYWSMDRYYDDNMIWRTP